MRAASVVQLFSDDDDSIDPRTFFDLDDHSWGAEEESPATTATQHNGDNLNEDIIINQGPIGSPALEDFEDLDEGPFSWEHAEIASELRRAVSDSLSFKEMTRIQKLAMAPILNGRDVVGTAETGSGKTLAFLLPICHGILQKNPELSMSWTGNEYSIENCLLWPSGDDGGGEAPRMLSDATPKLSRLECGGCVGVRCLILSPTREIAIQTDSVAKKICRYTRIRSTVVCGGVKQNHQEVSIRSGVEIVCACPGRLLDLLRRGLNSEFFHLQYLVFDEADRILDLGFLPDITDLLALLPSHAGRANPRPARSNSLCGPLPTPVLPLMPPSHARQTLLFSATMPKDVMNIAQTYLNKPIIRIGLLESEAQQVFTIHENVWSVPSILKADFLLPLIRYRDRIGNQQEESQTADATAKQHYQPESGDGNCAARKQTLIFARTKARANRVCELLTSAGIRADRIHGNRSQSARVKALTDFKNGDIRVLVATDVAARGIDLKTLDMVINFDIPATPEEYVHRAGRVGRAGAHGRCWTLVSEDEVDQLRSIEQWIGRRLPVHAPLPGFDYHSTNPVHIITKSGHNEEQVPPPPPTRHIRQTSLPVTGSCAAGAATAHYQQAFSKQHRSSGGAGRQPNAPAFSSGDALGGLYAQQPHSRPNHRRQRSAGPQVNGGAPNHRAKAPPFNSAIAAHPANTTSMYYHHQLISPMSVQSPMRGGLPHRFGMHADLRMNRRPGGGPVQSLKCNPGGNGYRIPFGGPPGLPPPHYNSRPLHRRAISSEAASSRDYPGGSALTQASMVWKSRLQGPQGPAQKCTQPKALDLTTTTGYYNPVRQRYLVPSHQADELHTTALWSSLPSAGAGISYVHDDDGMSH